MKVILLVKDLQQLNKLIYNYLSIIYIYKLNTLYMGCCCSLVNRICYGADYDDEMRSRLLPSKGVKEQHYDIYAKYLNNISFLKALSDNNNVYKVKYNDRIGILKINYDIKNYLNELNVCKKLTNISQVSKLISEEIFNDNNHIKGGILFYEYIPGIDLWKYFVDYNKKLPEVKVKSIMVGLVNVISNLHHNKIIHGDIKLENIICKNNNPYECHLIDFNQSIYVESDDEIIDMPHPCGTIPLVAPETIISRKIGYCSDIWSLGCTMYLLLFYKHAFNNDTSVFNDSMLSCSSQLEDLKTHCYGIISDDCIDFLFNMLNPDVNARYTAEQLLTHRWFIS